jgi:hypothetical protein
MLFSVSCFELDKPCSVAGIVLRRSGYSAFLQGTKFNKLILNCKIKHQLYFD